MKQQEGSAAQPAIGAMFDRGTFYRSLGCDMLDYYDQDTFRNFIDKEHRDWDASHLRAHQAQGNASTYQWKNGRNCT